MEERKYRFISETSVTVFETQTQIALNHGYVMLSPAQYLVLPDGSMRYIREMVKSEPSSCFILKQ